MAQNVALLRFSCFLTPVWPETFGLRLQFSNQQCDNAKTHLQKKIWLKNALFLSILSFQVEKKNQLFFHRMCTLFLLDNQVYFILTTIMWCKFWRKIFLHLWKYSYEAYKWIFTWNSKHTNSLWKGKCKKRKMKESMSQSCPFSWFSFNYS